MYGRESGIKCGKVRGEGFVGDYKCNYIGKDMKEFFLECRGGRYNESERY